MNKTVKDKGLIKKAIAVILGITMAFGTLMVPDSTINDELTTASAYAEMIDGTTYLFDITDKTGTDSIKINKVAFTGDTLNIPSTITCNGVEYPVTEIGDGFLKDNSQIKTIIIPDSVTYIHDNVLYHSSVEKIILSNNLEHIGNSFAGNCFSLSSIECTGSNIHLSEIGSCILQNCFNMENEKGAICIGNWLLYYSPPSNDITEVKIADLGNNGVKIDSIGNYATGINSNIATLDLEGVKVIGNDGFSKYSALKQLINCDDIEQIGEYAFNNTPWLEEAKSNDLEIIGSLLVYYKTDDNVIDLTSGAFEGIKSVNDGALKDCKNIDTIICHSDCLFGRECFYTAHDQESTGGSSRDTIPLIPTYNIKKVFIDGKELTYSMLWKDHDAYEWLRLNSSHLRGSAFLKDMVEEKTEELFRQMDIPYYGMNNDKMGTHTPAEEFNIRLKIHSYLSQYPYDHEGDYLNETGAFLLGGKLDCMTYAYLTQYMLECTGIESKTLSGYCHYWNSTKIGDEWFESDDGWDAQVGHDYVYFCQSSDRMAQLDPTYHKYSGAYDSFHMMPNQNFFSERVNSERVLGDINGDNIRDNTDIPLLWAYLKGESDTIDEKAADINFDGKIDVTDGVLLENFVKGTAIDTDNVYSDGFAPTVKVAFVNGDDYDNIKYAYTDREGYIKLPADMFEAPEGKKLSYDIGAAGEKVRITTPLTVVSAKWTDENSSGSSEPDSSSGPVSKPDSSDLSSRPDSGSKSDSGDPSSSGPDSSRIDKTEGKLGDVNNDGAIDIEDAVAIIQHINGVTPLTKDEESRADVSKDKNIDIDDAVILISYINGNSTF